MITNRTIPLAIIGAVAMVVGFLLARFEPELGVSIACVVPGIMWMIALLMITDNGEAKPQSTIDPFINTPFLTNNRQRGSAVFSDDMETPPNADIQSPLPHAIKAVELAKPSPKMLTKIMLRDIGFIASWDTHKHHIYRTHPIPTSAHSIQPYIQVYLTEIKGWKFDFEVYDAKRKLLFKHQVSELLHKGYHLIVPPVRLPLESPPQVETWAFGVRVNGKLLAGHRFTWREVTSDALADYLDSDGEIGDDALLLLGEHYTTPLSLDDLLTKGSHEAKRNLSDVQ